MKISDINIGMIYGDLRQKLLIELLAQDGYTLQTFGFEDTFKRENVVVHDNYMDVVKNSDIIIAPTPISKDGKNLFTIYDYLPILSIDDLFKVCSGKLLFAGAVTDIVKNSAKEHDILIFDLLNAEQGAILNAIPTGEGAIQIAMEESDITMYGSTALILGYGHCGKILAQMLKGIGVNVYVCARKIRDITYAKAYGYNSFRYPELNQNVNNFDFIFNTVPAMVIDRNVLKHLKQSCIIIDLASAPGGTDFETAKEYNIKALFCPSLPGRVAPRTVANTMRECILNILKEEGENCGKAR